jgi:hypothetical protein
MMLVVVLFQFMAAYVCLAESTVEEPEIAFYLVEVGEEVVRQYKKDKGTCFLPATSGPIQALI